MLPPNGSNRSTDTLYVNYIPSLICRVYHGPPFEAKTNGTFGKAFNKVQVCFWGQPASALCSMAVLTYSLPHTVVIIAGHQTPRAPPTTAAVFLSGCITGMEEGMTLCVCVCVKTDSFNGGLWQHAVVPGWVMTSLAASPHLFTVSQSRSLRRMSLKNKHNTPAPASKIPVFLSNFQNQICLIVSTALIKMCDSIWVNIHDYTCFSVPVSQEVAAKWTTCDRQRSWDNVGDG